MSPFFSFLVIVIVGTLNIVLFIKIWAMTNDVRRILSFLDASRAVLVWDDAMMQNTGKVLVDLMLV